MTPFARLIFEMAMEKRDSTVVHFWGDRTVANHSGVRELTKVLYDAHFFEVTEVLPHLNKIREEFLAKPDHGLTENAYMAFTPAPVTWIEMDLRNLEYNGSFDGAKSFYDQSYIKKALLIHEYKTDKTHKQISYMQLGFTKSGHLEADKEPSFISVQLEPIVLFGELKGLDYLVLQVLWAINKPRMFGQTYHDMHKGFARKISNSGIGRGHFPLRTWTEIQLPIGPVEDRSDTPPQPSGLTWNNPLHFVRKHLRRGKEIEAFWRGDPALGIKRSRYVLVNRIEPPSHLAERIPKHLR